MIKFLTYIYRYEHDFPQTLIKICKNKFVNCDIFYDVIRSMTLLQHDVMCYLPYIALLTSTILPNPVVLNLFYLMHPFNPYSQINSPLRNLVYKKCFYISTLNSSQLISSLASNLNNTKVVAITFLNDIFKRIE